MFIAALIQKLHQWLRYREMLRDLAQRSDRELADFGFERTNLRRIARQAAKS